MGQHARPSLPRAVYALAAAVVVLELAVSSRYGYHRDELYFLQCFRHLAFGYVDQPPLTPIVAGLGNAVFHGSLVGFRLMPALAMGTLVVVTAAMAREMAADRFAQGFAALSAALTAEYVGGAHLVSPTIFDWLAWAVGLFVVLRLLRTGHLRLWVVLGAVVGIGLENKWNIAFFVLGLGVGFLVTPERRLLRSRWVLVGGALALALWMPNLVWQGAHGWPQLKVFSALQGDAGHNRLVYLPAQLLYIGLFLTPVWIAGLVRMLRSPEVRRYRSLGWMFVFILILFFALGGKPYYPGGMYTVVLAAGSTPAARFLRAPRRRVMRPAFAIAGLVIASAALLPVALPVLPMRTLATVPLQNINYDLAETIGWPRFVATVAGVYRSLPPAERATAVILTANYGEAGAIDRYGDAYALPTAYSGHNNFWLWGPPPEPRGVTVAVNLGPQELGRYFRQVMKVATFRNGVGVDDDEQGAAIYVCRGQRASWAVIWPSLRGYG